MLMVFIVAVGVLFVLTLFPYFRFGLFHPVTTIKNAVRDGFLWIKHKEYNVCNEYGRIFMFTAADSQAFGSGKTLSLVHWLRQIYQRYNNVDVWDKETNSFVKQHIIIVSNVVLNDIPFIPFIGKSQFIELDKIEHTEHDVIIFVIDEAGMEFNSRNYKDNLSTDFLRRLLQVRHHKICFAMTSQRFTFTDKVLRSTCEIVTTCKKKWRIVRLQDFDAYDLENISNPLMLRPISTRFYFATDRLYNAYDTTYNVEKLKEQLEEGDLLDTTRGHYRKTRSLGIATETFTDMWFRIFRTTVVTNTSKYLRGI